MLRLQKHHESDSAPLLFIREVVVGMGNKSISQHSHGLIRSITILLAASLNTNVISAETKLGLVELLAS